MKAQNQTQTLKKVLEEEKAQIIERVFSGFTKRYMKNYLNMMRKNVNIQGYYEVISRETRFLLLIRAIQKFGGVRRVAEILGISTGTISAWLSRETHPSNWNLKRLVDLLIADEIADKLLVLDITMYINEILRSLPPFLRERVWNQLKQLMGEQ